MKNTKYQEFNAGRAGSGKVNLASGQLEFMHEDTVSDSNTLPISISHIFLSEEAVKQNPDLTYGQGFKLNLQQKLIKTVPNDTQDTRYDYYDAAGVKHEFEEKYYYRNPQGEKTYHVVGNASQALTPNDITIGFDGKLSYVENPSAPEPLQIKHEIFTETKTKSGLELQTELKNFKNSEKIETRHEELIKVDEEVKSLTRSIEDLEYALLENETINGQSIDENSLRKLQKKLDALSRNLEEQMITDFKNDLEPLSIPSKTKEAIMALSVPQISALSIAEKQEYLQDLKKEYQKLFEKSDIVINKVKPTSIITESNWASINYSLPRESTFTYKDEDGKIIDSVSAGMQHRNYTKVIDSTDPDNAEDVLQRKRYAALAVAQQNFNSKCERIRQKMEEISSSLESENWENQKTSVDSRSILFKKQQVYLQIKNNHDDERFSLMVDRAKVDLVTANNLLAYKEFVREKIKEQIPVNFILCKNGTMLGFNKSSDLVVIINNYDNQIAVVYEDERITRLVDENQREIVLVYKNNRLISITDFQDRKTTFEYLGNLLRAINYPDGEQTTFEYNNSLLAQILPPSKIGLQIGYTNNKPTSISEVSQVKSIKTTGVENSASQTRGILEIEYNASTTRVIDSETGAQSTCFIDANQEIIAEYEFVNNAAKSLIMYDNKSEEYNFVQQKTDFNSNPDINNLVSSFTAVNGMRTLQSVESIADAWAYSRFNDEQKKTGEWYSKKVLEKFVDGVKTGETHIKNRKAFVYDSKGNLAKEEFYEIKDPGPEILVAWQSYEYNKQNKPIRMVDNEGMVTETVYDEKGNAEKTMMYHKSNPAAKRYEEVKEQEKDGNAAVHGIDSYNNGIVSISASNEDGESNSTKFIYTKDFLTSLTSGKTEYEYEYDAWGRKTCIKVADAEYIRYEYVEDGVTGKKTITAIYANGENLKTIVQKSGKIESVSFNGVPYIANQYDQKDRLVSTMDYVTGKTTSYEYDKDDNLVVADDGEIRISTDLGKDDKVEYIFKVNDVEIPTLKEEVGKDAFGRVTSIKGQIERQDIYYCQKGDRVSNLVSSVYHGSDRTNYRYDTKGNITEVLEKGQIIAKYEYDNLNRLVKEEGIFGVVLYGYDNNGNILYKNNLTTGEILDYKYDRDKLIDFAGAKCVYDSLGNPTVYRDKDLSWNCLKNLKSYDGIQFGYNAEGLRVSKNQTKYFYAGNRLIAEKRALLTESDIDLGDYLDEGVDYYSNAKSLNIEYLYGANGVAGFQVDGVPYYYRKNIQGDITHIFDEEGKLKAKYVYDAWGRHMIYEDEDKIGSFNAFRYRGYYMDIETGLYYLLSRYYDPGTGRFLNADSIEIFDAVMDFINGLNLYAYCFNNPVNTSDEYGDLPKWLRVVIGVVAVVVAITICVLTLGTAAPVLIGLTVGAVLGGGFEIGKQLLFEGGIHDWGAIGWAMFGGAVAGAVSAIPVFGGFGISSYFGTAMLGGTASVLGGLVSGSVTDIRSGAIAFGIGAFASVAAKGVQQLRINHATNKTMNINNLGDRSNSINNYLIAKNVKPVEMGQNAFGGWSRNIFKSMPRDVFKNIVTMTTQRSTMVYSAIISSFLSGWY